MEEAGKKPANHESRTEYESGDFNAVGEVERLREELRRENSANVGVKSYAPRLSWEIIQNRFNNWKTSLSLYSRKHSSFREKR